MNHKITRKKQSNIKFFLHLIIMDLKEKFNTSWRNLKTSINNKIIRVKTKTFLIDSLTNSELEKIYQDYISKNLKVEIKTLDNKISYRPITRNELKRSIRKRISMELLKDYYPRLIKLETNYLKQFEGE